MANNKLTAKEVTLISDLLKYEESACKKARLYSRTLTRSFRRRSARLPIIMKSALRRCSICCKEEKRMQSKQQIQLNEKDSLQDMLNLEKEIVKLYSTALTEGNGSKFRTMVKNHLVDSANDQFEVFTQMAENNYYEVKPADKAVIDEQKANFKQVLAQLS